MKTVNLFAFTLFLGILSFNLGVLAQDSSSTASDSTEQNQDEGHFFVMVTWETLRPEGGTRAELDSLLSLYQENVIQKNELIVSEKNLWHLYGRNSQDWIVLTEYANWNDIEASVERNNELIAEQWPDPEERRAFNRALTKYFGKHSDEIYLSAPQFDK